MKTIQMALFAVALVSFSAPASAQTVVPAQDCTPKTQADGTRLECRFRLDAARLGSSLLFPELPKGISADGGDIDQLTLYRAAIGDLGDEIQKRFMEAAAWPAFGRCDPNNDCERTVPKLRLSDADRLEYRTAFEAYWHSLVEKIRGGDRKSVELLVGSNGINTDLSAPLAYGFALPDGKIMVRPTLYNPYLNFNAKGIRLGGIELAWGPHKGELFELVIITSFKKADANIYQSVGAGNFSGFLSRKAEPVATEARAEPATAGPMPVAMAVDVTSLTVFMDKHDRPLRILPKGWEAMAFDTLGTGENHQPELKKVTRTIEENGVVSEFEAVEMVFHNVKPGEEFNVIGRRGVRGYADKTQTLRIAAPAVDKPAEYPPPYVHKKKSRCSWTNCVLIPALSAVVAIPFFLEPASTVPGAGTVYVPPKNK